MSILKRVKPSFHIFVATHVLSVVLQVVIHPSLFFHMNFCFQNVGKD